MITNYLLTAIRNLRRNLSFTIINVIGLSVAMAITVVSLLYISNEFSYDRFHVKKDRIYRVILKSESNSEGTYTSSEATAGIAPSLYEEIPEVESMLRLSNPRSCFFSFEEKNFPASNMMYADSSFFEIFSFNLLVGNKKSVLTRPYTAILTKSYAQKIFEDEKKAIGKSILLNNKDKILITGIVEDPPVQSHLQFEILISFTSLYQNPQIALDWNGGHRYFNYIILKENTEISQVEQRLSPILEKNINSFLRSFGIEWFLQFQPLKDVHLFSDFDNDIFTHGNLKFIFILLSITLFVLFIACINFINLTTAASLSRMKEVGVRKVVGATRSQIIWQFMTETIILSIVSLILAFLIIEIGQTFLPSVLKDPFLIEQIRIYNSSFWQITAVLIFVVLFVGVVAGSYPAIYMSRFQAVKVLKGHLGLSRNRPVFRSLLIVFQFTISAILILCTLIIVSQMNYLLKQDLGFNPDHKLIISLDSESSAESYEALKSEFISIAGVEDAGASSDIPGNGFTMNGYIPEGLSDPIMIHAIDIDYDYLNSMDLDVVQGRNFSKEFGTDHEAFIINQTLAKQMGWVNPIGKTISRGGDHKVIGVVKDFHYSSLHKQIEPLLITLQPWQGYNCITIKYSGINEKELIQQLEDKWKKIIPNENFNYIFLKSYIHQAYTEEIGFAWILGSCSGLAVFIAAMGLFGLAAYMARQRSREMAIRKVFGAGIKKIFVLLSTDFMKWIIVANVIAIPVAYFLMDKWLQYFIYHGGFQIWIFATTFIFCILLAALIILFQILRLQRLNPIDFIRYE